MMICLFGASCHKIRFNFCFLSPRSATFQESLVRARRRRQVVSLQTDDSEKEEFDFRSTLTFIKSIQWLQMMAKSTCVACTEILADEIMI